jgi:hypothetical protein
MCPAAVQAQRPLPKESGFSGYIELLGGVFSSDSQLNAESDNAKTDTLDGPGERVNKAQVVPLGLVNYTFAEARTQIYFGVLPENVAEGQIQVEAGVRHDLADGTILRVSAIPWTPLEAETWSDPYVIGQDRIKSDIESYGIKLAAENIKNSAFSLKLGWATQDIDNEKSGTFLLSQPGSSLTPADLNSLDRDANFFRLTGEYTYKITPRMHLKPILKYTRSDAEGGANSYHGLMPQISFQYFGKRFQTAVNAAVNAEDYDDTHPVFGKTRRDYNTGVYAIIGYRAPFGLKDFRVDWFNGVFKNYSNIDFYESTSLFSFIGCGYIF